MSDPEDRHRAENLLRSLELRFLTQLAEHQSEERFRLAAEREQRRLSQLDPKAEAAPSASGSETPTEPGSSDGVDIDPTHVYVYVKADKDQLDNYIEAIAHVVGHDCEVAQEFLNALMATLVDTLVVQARKKDWYEDAGSLLSEEDHRAYLEWLEQRAQRKEQDDDPEGEAGEGDGQS